jgi:cytochrome c-type biogenesis protein CcmH/NrfG
LFPARRPFVPAAVLAALLAACVAPPSQDPRDAIGWYCRGVYLESRGQYAQACDAYERAHDLDPQACEPAVAYARGLLRSGDREKAIAVLEAAHKRAPQDVSVLSYLAELTFRGGLWRSALRYNALLLRARPDLVAPAHHLTSLLRHEDDTAEIMALLREMAKNPHASSFLVTTVTELDQR